MFRVSVSLCTSPPSNETIENQFGPKQLHVGTNNQIPNEWDGRKKFLPPCHFSTQHPNPELQLTFMTVLDRLEKKEKKNWSQIPDVPKGLKRLNVFDAWRYLQTTGLQGSKDKKKKTKAPRIKCQEVYQVLPEEWNIRAEVYHHGPVTASLPISEEFSDFLNALLSGATTNPIWKDVDLESDQWLTVRIVGWGVSETNELYWIVAGNWGVQLGADRHEYGRNGYFLVQRGQNGPFENHVFSGLLKPRDCCKSQESYPIQVLSLGEECQDKKGKQEKDVSVIVETPQQILVLPSDVESLHQKSTSKVVEKPVIDLDNPLMLLLCGCIIMIVVLIILMGLSFMDKRKRSGVKVPSSINVPPTKKTVRFAPHVKQE